MHTGSALHARVQAWVGENQTERGMSRKPVLCWVWIYARAPYFVCEIGEIEALKLITDLLFWEQADFVNCI